MLIFIYFTIGFFYWSLNCFVRKLDTDGNWLLPLIWFIAWPIPILAWLVIATGLLVFQLGKFITKITTGNRF